MKIQPFPDYESLSQKAANRIIEYIQKKPNALLCIATGNSPKRTYELLFEHEKSNPNFFQNISIIQLDEWIGLSEKDEPSCSYFIQNQLLEPLKIDRDKAFFFNGQAENPNQEIERANLFLDENGGIDLCILGMGKNGHLGFNEPAEMFSKRTHLVALEKETQTHSMVEDLDTKPQFGITLGIEDIMNSKKVMLIVAGKGKEAVFKKFQTQKITPKVPVSALWGHGDCECFINQKSF